MQFVSTRNRTSPVSFEHAVLDCMPSDGGLYVPAGTSDLRRWIMYTGKKTSFASIAGTLTSAFINDEFSPIICETIATRAFTFEPALKQLDDNHFMLELFHGPTGCHRDFGVAYLVSFLETILQIKGGNAVFVDVTKGELGAILARELRGKKHTKAVCVYPRGMVRGIEESDYVWNGGNIYPVEVDGSEEDCHALVRSVFAEHDFVQKHHLTVANTANIGRLLPQVFFYPFAFSRLKKLVQGDIYYALAPGNYSNVVAGLYSWRFALPLNGFLLPATDALTVDPAGNCMLLDSVVPVQKRNLSDPSDPSNLERLEEVFSANRLMMRNFLYPVRLTDEEVESAVKKLYMKYGVLADRHTARAYAAALAREELAEEDAGSVVIIARDHPSFSSDYIRQCTGEKPVMPENVSASLRPVKLEKNCIRTFAELKAIIISL